MANILDLPDELLRKILVLAHPDLALYHSANELIRRTYLCDVLSICSRLRSIVRTMTKLWSRIAFPPESLSGFIEECLRYAGTRPLEIEVDLRTRKICEQTVPRIRDLLKLKSHCKQWGSLKLTCAGHSAGCPSIFNFFDEPLHLPALAYLELLRSAADWEDLKRLITNVNAPNLKYLVISGLLCQDAKSIAQQADIIRSSTWINISSLTLRRTGVTSMAILSFASNFPNLALLKTSSLPIVSYDARSTQIQIQLPKLQHFMHNAEVEVEMLPKILHAPNLTSWTLVDTIPNDVDAFFGNLSQYRAELFPRLHTLGIYCRQKDVRRIEAPYSKLLTTVPPFFTNVVVAQDEPIRLVNALSKPLLTPGAFGESESCAWGCVGTSLFTFMNADPGADPYNKITGVPRRSEPSQMGPALDALVRARLAESGVTAISTLQIVNMAISDEELLWTTEHGIAVSRLLQRSHPLLEEAMEISDCTPWSGLRSHRTLV